MDLKGTYLDGQTPSRQIATVRLSPKTLQIILEKGTAIIWPYEEIRQAKHYYGDVQIRLERGGNVPEVLQIPGLLFFKKLREVAPEEVKRFHGSTGRKRWAAIALFAAVGVIGLTAALYLWGIPAMAFFLSSRIPISWEKHLGQAVVEELAPPEKQCQDSARAHKIEEILTTLTSSSPHSPYTFRVILVNNPSVNALAVPGGTLVIFQGLLERTSSAEELAGVLAHEMQHILHRHAIRALLNQVSLKLLLAAVVGDAKALSLGLEGVQIIGMFRYSRQNEEEADREGIKMLMAAGIDPGGMIRFFEAIHKENEQSLKQPTYLSTHPDLADRIQRLKRLTGEVQGPWVTLLEGYHWKDIYGFCPTKLSH